jgi:hypothetical protein
MIVLNKLPIVPSIARLVPAGLRAKIGAAVGSPAATKPDGRRQLGGRGLGLWAVVLLIGTWVIGLAIAPSAAWAQFKEYAPPVSYSNAELSGQDFSNQRLQSAEFSNANLTDVTFENAEMPGASFSGSFLKDTNLHGVDLTNAFMDSVKFIGTDLSDAILVEAILLGSSFQDVNIEGADFELALLDGAQVKQLCAIARGTNPRTGIDTKESLGCP